jgi:glucosamine--fructose-6-phosphate aminotransferase (isomerizing)
MSDVPPSTLALERQIASQPDELTRLLDQPIPHSTVEGIRQAHRIWLVGTGTSQHAAELGAMMFHEAGRGAHAMSSMHFVNWAPPIDPLDAVILISHNAGTETSYAGAAWSIAIHAGLGVVPITRRGGQMPGAIETVEKETSHTYTVSYTAVLLLLARLALELGADAFDRATLERIPEAVRGALADPGTAAIAAPPRLLVLSGEGPSSVTAREGALKVREASRFPCEGYDIEYLLHGHAVPLSAEDHLVLLTPPDTDGLVDGVATAAAREGVPLTRVREPADLPPLLAQIPLVARLQLLALRFARERGFDPDVAIERAWADEGLWAIGSPRPGGASA